MNNVTIVEMKNQGLSETIIVAKIRSSKSSFDTSSTALQSLKKAGISDLVILAMVQKASGMDIIASASNSSINTDLGDTATSVAIPDGTEIKIVTAEEISGQKVAEGDPLSFKIEEDVKINGKTVIAKDTLVRGTVASAKKKGFMGKGGELSVRIESTQTVDGQKLKLRAAKSDKGNDNLGSTVALTVLFGPLGLLRRGKEAKIKAGTVLTAYTDEVKTVLAR
ncbi:MAG: hypothetical protein WKF71_16265 [Pyrinomonadaceae bacterium]